MGKQRFPAWSIPANIWFRAIVILISTIAVKDIVPLVFLLGMVSSTILEFCTGCCMEKLLV